MYNLTSEEVFSKVKTSRNGLTQSEAKNRLLENGKNKVNLDIKRPLKTKIGYQLNQIVMFVLLFALVANVVAVVLTKDLLQLINIVLIFVIMVLNVVVGVCSSSKMERVLVNVKEALTSTVRVKRNGRVFTIKSEELVLGDIVYLEAGDYVPADIRLIDTNNLKVVDTVITGQTMPTDKYCDVIDGKYMPLGDRNNMIYLGSSVYSGSCTGVVIATGKDTELGKTEKLLSDDIGISTPFIRKLNNFISLLSYFVLIISVIGFTINIIRGKDISDSFMVAVSLAVCVVPESLIISIYSTLSKGVKKLGKHNLLVKDLSSIENLGDIDVLCVDKSKVLTLNDNTVCDIWVSDMDSYDLEDNPNFSTLINCMVLSNDAIIELQDDNSLVVKGCSTEKALLNYAFKKGYSKDNIQGIFPQVNIFPFDRYRKVMTTLNSVGEKTYSFTKGDFEKVFSMCNTILIDGKSMLMTEYDKQFILKIYQGWRDSGHEVMGFATREVGGNIYELSSSDVEKEMTFVGLCSISDPPKEDTPKTLKEFSKLGVRVVMLTSDGKENAFLVAKNMGIAKSPKQVITGKEIDLMTDVELFDRVHEFTVFSKLLSGQKLRIVKALQQDSIVGVTGDNAEDISAIKQANVGIGLAKSGCEVVKQTSHILTQDDSLNSIKEGIIESRKIQFNIRKMVEYLLSAGVAQILLLTLLVVVCGKTFFSPTLILWLSFINGFLPCIGLGEERLKFDINKKTDCNVVFSKQTFLNIFLYGFLQAIIIGAMYFVLESYLVEESQIITMCFVTLAFVEIFHAYNLKNYEKSIFASNPLNNMMLNLGFVVTLVCTIIFFGLPIPILNNALNTTTISFVQWLICFGAGALIIVFSELVKLIKQIVSNKK